MKVIIFGSTGPTGQQIVKQALEQGHDVTAFVRSPEKLNQKHENLQAIKGDVLDYASVEDAIRGQDAVLCAIGRPPTDKNNLRANGTKNIIRAMEKTGVKRFICQSSDGVGDSADRLPFLYKYLIVPLMLRRVFADHALQEDHIKKSRLDWVIARPTALTNGEHTGAYQQGYAADNKTITHKISRADTADFMLKQLAANNYLHQTPSLSY